MPKQLVPVANKPILFHNLEALRAAGVLEATIVVDARTSGPIRAAVADGSAWGIRVDYTECPHDTGIDAALQAAPETIRSEPLLIEPADVLLRDRMGLHIASFAGERLDALALRLEGGATDDSGGCLLSPRAVAFLLDRPGVSSDALARVRRQGGSVRVQDVEGMRPCHGDQEVLLEGNRRMLEHVKGDAEGASVVASRLQGRVVVHPTARIERSLVRGPAIIGAGVRLTDAYVGPYTSVGDGVVIEGSEIEHSIVLENAELRFVGTRLESSVIGRSARVARSFDLPSTMRLNVGEGADITLS